MSEPKPSSEAGSLWPLRLFVVIFVINAIAAAVSLSRYLPVREPTGNHASAPEEKVLWLSPADFVGDDAAK